MTPAHYANCVHSLFKLIILYCSVIEAVQGGMFKDGMDAGSSATFYGHMERCGYGIGSDSMLSLDDKARGHNYGGYKTTPTTAALFFPRL